jgi:hypothetical protein
MIVTLKDRTKIYVSEEKGERLKQALLDPETPDYLQLNDTFIRKEFIVMVEPGGTDPASQIKNDKQIAAPDYRGTANETIDRVRRELQKKMVI